ncbi:MAG: NAD/NADP octopine/nopaline dehydrogenase family protein [bacterium]
MAAPRSSVRGFEQLAFTVELIMLKPPGTDASYTGRPRDASGDGSHQDHVLGDAGGAEGGGEPPGHDLATVAATGTQAAQAGTQPAPPDQPRGGQTPDGPLAMRVGIYGVSTQSGKAFLADMLDLSVSVYGYARFTGHGQDEVLLMRNQGGIHVDRPKNNIGETYRFAALGDSKLGHDPEALVDQSDLIILCMPATFHEESAILLRDGLLKHKHRIPLLLSPSRTLATPYLWKILGEGYPIISFQTSPYSAKTMKPGTVYIKRRKQAWLATLEGDMPSWVEPRLRYLFPQIIYGKCPAANSLGNIGAVFHPAAYMLNLEAIQAAAAREQPYSFYIDGITDNPVVGPVVEEIDQIRLQIAQKIGCPVFGLRDNPREEEWRSIMREFDEIGRPTPGAVSAIRLQRANVLQSTHDAVVSAQHWLQYTYGVERIPGESLASAIGRTGNYRETSFPQRRYADEDIPTGLVPFESLAKRLAIPHGPITRVINLYKEKLGINARKIGRSLKEFTTDYLVSYLCGSTTGAACGPTGSSAGRGSEGANQSHRPAAVSGAGSTS